MQSVDTIILGNGISSKVMVYYLNKIGLYDIHVFASDSFAPACSTRTTAINCLRGTQKGISSLGDLIVDSYGEFERFFEQNTPAGVCRTQEYQCWPLHSPHHDKWLQRFKSFQSSCHFPFFTKSLTQHFNFVASNAYIFSPEIFYQWLDQSNCSKLYQDVVTHIQNHNDKIVINTQQGREFECKRLIVCTSYMTSNFSHLVKDEKLKRQLEHSKPVPGTYMRFHQSEFNDKQINFEKSFSFVIDDIHFIYRKQSEDILLGSTTTNNQMNFLHDQGGMQNQYQRFSHYMKDCIDLPSFDFGQLITGVRHKGQRRTPFWGKINENIYAVWGLYKNAFTMAFSAAKEVQTLVQK